MMTTQVLTDLAVANTSNVSAPPIVASMIPGPAPVSASSADKQMDSTTGDSRHSLKKNDEVTSAQQSEQDLSVAAQELEEALEPLSTSVKFSVDKEAGKMVLKVLNTLNGDVIRQIPTEEALSLARHARELSEGGNRGLVFDQSV